MSDQGPITRVSEPMRQARRRASLWALLGRMIFTLVLVALVAGGLLAWAAFNITAPGPLEAKKIVQFPKGADRAAIASQLQQQGVIADTRLFSATALADEVLRKARLKPGEYEFPASVSIETILGMMNRGDFVKYKVTIPEGWTSQMVVNRLNEQDMLDGPIATVPPEGSLLPETYLVTRGTAREKVLADMAAAQTKLLDSLTARLPAEGPVKSKEAVVTLASIVEKETGVAEERPQVAAVFLNRLKQKMRLQSDPTIIYGLVGGKGKLDHAITKDELESQTPYNTYQIDGLPPGPIANPGKAAIEAVLNPANVPYLYFVANGTGGHAFATTLDEHNANVRKWRSLNGQADPATAGKATAPNPPAKAGPLSSVVTPPAAPVAPAPKPVAPAPKPVAKPQSLKKTVP